MTYADIGYLMGGKDHATIKHSERVVDEQLETRHVEFVKAITNWADIFNNIMPDLAIQVWSTKDRIRAAIETTLLSRESKRKLLEELLEDYQDELV